MRERSMSLAQIDLKRRSRAGRAHQVKPPGSPMSSASVHASAALPPVESTAIKIAAAVTTAVAAERDRIRGILEAPEAKGREESAAATAFGGGFTVAQARNVLSTLRTDEDAQFDAFVQQVERSAAAKRARQGGAVAR